MRPWLRLAVLVLPIVSALATAACGSDGEPASPEAPSPQPPSSGELAEAVVQVLALDADLEPVWSGSGTVITPGGLTLTNAHVVDDRAGEYDVLGVAVSIEADEPPELSYLAEIVAVQA